MQHKDRLSDDERKARRREAARKYREANREKTRAACRAAKAKKRLDPEFRELEKAQKQDPGYKQRQSQYRRANKDALTRASLEWREANRDRYLAYQREYQEANRQRTCERGQDWRSKNRDRARAYETAWREANRDRRAINQQRRRGKEIGNGGTLSPDIYKRLMVLQKSCCASCRKRFGSERAHLDHIMPLSRGGASDDANMQLLCRHCNLSKHAKHPVDFMQERGFLL